jgi:hypothetical protein
MEILKQFIQHFLTVVASPFKDAVYRVFIDTHYSGSRTDAIPFS